jgi:hypothetical protein
MLAGMRSRAGSATVALLSTWACLACTPSQPTAAPIVAALAKSAPVAVTPPEPAPDLSPLPAPGGLSMTLHLAHPRATTDLLASLLGSSPWLALLGTKLDAEELAGLAAGAPVGSLLDLDQPMDFAVSDVDSDDVTPSIAGSAVLSNPIAAREALSRYFVLEPTSPGIVRLMPRDDAPDNTSPRPCMMAQSMASTTRLVCGADKTSLLHLGPYLTRTMPRIATRSDLRFEVFTHGLHLPRSHETRVMTPSGALVVDAGATDPSDEMIEALFDRMSADLGSFVVEASSDGATLDLQMTTTFTAAASPVTRALVGQGTPDLQPPAAYASLPSDTSFAMFSRGAAPADLAPLKDTLLAMLLQWLTNEGYTPAEIEEQSAPLRRVILTGGPWVVGAGYRVDAARTALDGYVAGRSTSLAARTKAWTSLQGWAVAEIDEPAQPWIDALRTLAKFSGKKPSGKPLRKHKLQPEHVTLAVAPVPAALRLPDGSLHVEARTAENREWLAAQPRKPPPVPVIAHTSHLLLVPDGPRTWMAFAEDPAFAAAQVRAALDPTAPHASNAAAGGLEAIARSGGGFLTLAAVTMTAAGDTSDEELRKTRDALTSLATMPSGGRDPVPFAIVATPAASGIASGGDFSFRLLLPIGLLVKAADASPPIF